MGGGNGLTVAASGGTLAIAGATAWTGTAGGALGGGPGRAPTETLLPDVAAGASLGALKGLNRAVAWVPSDSGGAGSLLLSGTDSGYIVVWDPSTGSLQCGQCVAVRTTPGPDGAFPSIGWVSVVAASIASDPSVTSAIAIGIGEPGASSPSVSTAIITDHVVDPLGGKYASFQHEDWIREGVFSPSGCTLATASRDGTAKVWVCNPPSHRPCSTPYDRTLE
eukprot:gene7198-6800_t